MWNGHGGNRDPGVRVQRDERRQNAADAESGDGGDGAGNRSCGADDGTAANTAPGGPGISAE